MGVRKDEVQVELTIAAEQARTELDNLQRKTKVLGEDIKGLTKGTKEYAEASKEMRQINARIGELRKELGLTGLSYNQLNTLSGQLNRELRGLTPGTAQFIEKSRELQEVDKRLNQVRQEIKGIEEELKPAGNGFVNLLKQGAAIGGIALGAEAIVSGIFSVGRSVFDTTAKFEKYQAVLANALGDEKAAVQVLGEIQEMAAKTPFSVDELTASYIKFINRGLNPTMKDLGKLADVAASQGKSFDQLTEAVLDAGSGEFERLKEFGIQASKSGDQVELSFKGIQKTVQNTPEAINAALVAFGEVKGIAGSTAAISATLEGQLSNLGDTADQTAQSIGDELKPAFSAVLATIVFFLNIIKEVPAFIRENRVLFIGLGAAILSLNAANIAAAASSLYHAGIERGRAIATTASATAQRLLNAAMTANPIGLVVAAIALLVAGFITLYDKSEKFRVVLAGLGAVAKQTFQTMKEVAVQQLGGIANIIAGVFTGDADRIKKGLDGIKQSFATAYEGGAKAADAYNKGAAERQKQEDASRIEKEKQAADVRIKNAEAEAKKKADADKRATLASLKERESNIKAALALASAGSAEELRLKKLEVAIKRDIELQDEKKSAGEKKVIRAEATAELRKLQADFNKKQSDDAEKHAKEQLDIQKRTDALKNGLLQDESARRIAQLQSAAEQEKAQAKGTAEQIAEQRRLIEQKLSLDVAAERKKSADKEADELADIEKRKLALQKDEYLRRAGELRLAAAQEMRKVEGDDARSAQVRRLIQDKLQDDLVALEKERVEKQAEIMRRVEAIDQDIADKRAERGRNAAREKNPFSAAPDKQEKGDRLAELDREMQQMLANEDLTNNEKLARIRGFNDQKDALNEEYALKQKARDQAIADFAFTAASNGVALLADFAKIQSDKELAKVEKDKNRRLATLEAEFKSGKISKEQFEKQKTQIEANASQDARRIKKEAAENDKKAQIAQAVIAGVLAVIKAAPNVPLQIATGVLAAAGVAKIIATPIPEFEQGGVFGGKRSNLMGTVGRAWRGVKQYATGGQFNSAGGVPDRGQLHSSGGIKMVDGATGDILGEMERGEPYMILSRNTYANNRDVIDSLLDTSMNRGGAKIGPKYEQGGVFQADSKVTSAPSGAGDPTGQALVQEVRLLRGDVQRLKGQIFAAIGDEQVREIGSRLEDFAAQEAEATA